MIWSIPSLRNAKVAVDDDASINDAVPSIVLQFPFMSWSSSDSDATHLWYRLPEAGANCWLEASWHEGLNAEPAVVVLKVPGLRCGATVEVGRSGSKR